VAQEHHSVLKSIDQLRKRNGCHPPISLDSGLHSRLYDFGMATDPQTESMGMQIGEVAKRTSLTVDAIRFYEKRKLLPNAVRSAGRF
jgi:hypothetical protein